MAPRMMISLLLAASVVASGGIRSAAQDEKPASTAIRQIDHVMIQADDPEHLYSLFTKTLGLPAAWPLASYGGGFTSGGVGLGGVNIEVIRFGERKAIPSGKPAGARLVGIALEPIPLDDCLAELEKRGITHSGKRPYVSGGPDGSQRRLWTNVALRQFSAPDPFAGVGKQIFLCEYNPSFFNVVERRKRLREELTAVRGGPLGVDSLKEILVGTTDLEESKELWRRLLEPAPSSEPGVWRPGGGPAIHLIQASEDTIQGLVIRVRSLTKAEDFLREHDLLGTSMEQEATIDPSKIGGLNIRLVEK